MNIYIDSTARARLERAAAQTGRTVEDLASAAVEEAALDWDKANPEPKPDADHVMKAGIEPHDLGDLHKPHPLHDAIETAPEGEK
jgi:hypothetical protein